MADVDVRPIVDEDPDLARAVVDEDLLAERLVVLHTGDPARHHGTQPPPRPPRRAAPPRPPSTPPWPHRWRRCARSAAARAHPPRGPSRRNLWPERGSGG